MMGLINKNCFQHCIQALNRSSHSLDASQNAPAEIDPVEAKLAITKILLHDEYWIPKINCDTIHSTKNAKAGSPIKRPITKTTNLAMFAIWNIGKGKFTA